MARNYDANFRNFLKDRISVSSVVSKRARIIEKGTSKVCLCPFHHEKTPSFHINDRDKYYHCFGCGEHGDIITFVMKTEYLDFPSAVEKLAEDYSIPLPVEEVNTKGKQQEYEKINDIYKINELTLNFFCQNLFKTEGKNCLQYLYKRGMDDNNIKKFKFGYAPNSFNALMDFLKQNGVSEEKMLLAGVIARNKYEKFYDKFINRLMIPVFSKTGKVIAFTGRSLDKETMPKYMNSPETLIYHKSDVLFNYFFAKEQISKKKYAILVEGNFDAINLFINGVENVVAPMGTAITINQLQELWKITEEIVICLDGDEAGKKATKRVAEMCLPYLDKNKLIKILILPTGLDPDDFIKTYGSKQFLELFESKDTCLSLSEFLLVSTINDLKIQVEDNYLTAEQKTQLETKLKNYSSQIKNLEVQKNFSYFFNTEIYKLSRIDNKNFKNKNNSGDINSIKLYKDKSFSPNDIELYKTQINLIETHIVIMLLNNFNLIKELYSNYNVDIFSIKFLSNENSKILEELLNIFDKKEHYDKKSLINKLEKYNLKNYILGMEKDTLLNQNFSRVEYLYILILERSMLLLNIEARSPTIKNRSKTDFMEEIERINSEKMSIEKQLMENGGVYDNGKKI